MRGIPALTEAFALLRDRPLLFLPRLIVLTVMSGIWLWIASLFQTPQTLVIGDLYRIMAVLLLMVPIQLIVYNFYFVVVDQHNRDTIDIWEALTEAVDKLPRAGIVFGLAVTVMTLVSLPALLLIVIGYQQGATSYMLLGGIGSGIAMIVIAVLFYFTPVTVVIQDEPFMKAFRAGMDRSMSNSLPVFLITILSLVLLGIGMLMEGNLETIGMVGFVLARLVNGVVSVYLLVVNPALFYELE